MILLHAPNEIKAWRNSVKKAGYLNLWNDGAFLCTGAGEGRQRGRRHDRVGAGEVAQVAAGNLILLMAHDDGFHNKEAIPRQPEGVLLCDERCPLKPQDDGDAAIGDQVKAVREGRVEKERALVGWLRALFRVGCSADAPKERLRTQVKGWMCSRPFLSSPQPLWQTTVLCGHDPRLPLPSSKSFRDKVRKSSRNPQE